MANEGDLEIEKDLAARKPRMRAGLTPAGRAAFERHVAYLRAILDPDDGSEVEPGPLKMS